MNEIILNEKEWAKRAIDALSLGKHPYETIVRVAKYYTSEGYRRSDVRRKVEDFMIRSDPRLSLTKWDSSITSAIQTAEKYPPLEIPGVMVTEPEMRKIEALDGIIRQKVMFTLVCLARFSDLARKNNHGWVNFDYRDIFSLANVNITQKRQCLLINDLWKSGYVGYSCLVNNTNLQIKILEDGDDALFVDDFRNLGNQYMRYHGGQYFECEGCGLVLKLANCSSHQKYCRECAAEMKAMHDADRNYVNRLNRQFLRASQANIV